MHHMPCLQLDDIQPFVSNLAVNKCYQEDGNLGVIGFRPGYRLSKEQLAKHVTQIRGCLLQSLHARKAQQQIVTPGR